MCRVKSFKARGLHKRPLTPTLSPKNLGERGKYCGNAQLRPAVCFDWRPPDAASCIPKLTVVVSTTSVVEKFEMAQPKLSRLELRIMEVLWTHGASSVREVQEHFPEAKRPAYTTVQTMMYRLEAKKALRRTRKVSNAHIFEAVISRDVAQRRLVDEFLALFGGRMQPVMAHLVETGKLTLTDVQEAERLLREIAGRKRGRK